MFAGQSFANNLAKWDGQQWTGIASQFDFFSTQSLTVFDDGSGPALYFVAVFLDLNPTVFSQKIMRWDGAVLNASGQINEVLAFAIQVDRNIGDSLYIAGDFVTFNGADGSVPIKNVVSITLCPPATSNAADLNGDGGVNGSDLAVLLVNWG